MDLPRLRRVGVRLLLAFCWVVPLSAQSVVAGDLGPQSTATSTGAATLIDLNTPASGSGTVTTATVRWDGGGTACGAGFHVRFFRSTNGAIASLTLVAERGPFATPAGEALVTVPLNPAVAVQKGDLIGVYAVAGCGGVSTDSGGLHEAVLTSATNYAGGALPGDTRYVRGSRLSARASSGAAALTGIVPAVGALTGANNSKFRTTFELTNPSEETIRPQLVYHPAGRTDSAGDLSVTVELGARSTQVIEFSDAFQPTGLGTIDVYSTAEPAPQINARIYNDTGDGTNGFNEAMLRPGDALHAGETAMIVAPPDLTAARMSVGIRTLDEETRADVFIATESGHQFCSFSNDYQPRYFEQTTLQGFFRACAADNRYSAVVKVFSGALFLYTTTTDNRTNDSAISIARRR